MGKEKKTKQQDEKVLREDATRHDIELDEVNSLKRTISGLKGTNTERGKKIKALEEEIVEKKKVIDEFEGLASKQAMLCAKKDEKIKALEGELYKEKHKSLWEKIFG